MSSSWDQGKWWDGDKSEPAGGSPRCDHCVTKPKLVQSGLGDPKSLKCPVCKGLFDNTGQRFDAVAFKEQEKNRASRLRMDEEEAWESIWGSTQPPQGQTYCKSCYLTGTKGVVNDPPKDTTRGTERKS